MKLRLRFALVLLFLCGGAHGQDFAYRAPLATPGNASHYRFTLPAAAYEGTARRDLGDLRVLNAGGEPVPHAFVPREAQKAEPRLAAAHIFPLYGDPARSIDNTVVRVQRNASGTVVAVTVQNGASARQRRSLIGYLLDAADITRPLEALLLDWDAREPFTGHARVEASDDLRSWRTLVSEAPVLYLEHAGARLERRRVELGGARAKYLRLSFTGVPSAFALRVARLELKPERTEPAHEWRTLSGTQGKEAGEWLYDSRGHFPADRVRLHLPQPNTVVQVQVLTRSRADDPWRAAGNAVAYRLSRPAGEITNADIPVYARGERYWLVRLDQKGGGAGSGEVQLELGWLPHEVVFAARGSAPFSLVYGDAKAKPDLLPLSAVQPGPANGEDAVPAERAKVGEVTMVRSTSSFLDDRDVRKWTLWTVLVAGVALLGWMAFRLLGELGKKI